MYAAAGIVAFGLLCLGIWFGNSSIWWPATFRLVATSNFVGLQPDGPVTLQIEALHWNVDGATRIEPDAGQDVTGQALGAALVATRDSKAPPAGPTNIKLHVVPAQQGAPAEIRLQRIGSDKVTLEVAGGTTRIRVSPHPADVAMMRFSTGPNAGPPSVARGFGMDFGNHTAMVEFVPFHRAESVVARGIDVRGFGFARRGHGDDTRPHVAELVTGSLTFLELPSEEELKLSRGSDLRFRQVAATVDSLVLTDETILMTASGTAGEVQLFFGTHSRPVKPTLLKAAVGNTTLMFVMGFMGACASLLGLYFAYVSVRKELRRESRGTR